MSGLYNMIMGNHPYTPQLLGVLGIVKETVAKYPLGRFRDIYINKEADRIFILTRNYGDKWKHVDEALANHPNYIQKTSDQDPTFTVYEFSVPDEPKRKWFMKFLAENTDTTPAMERYRKVIQDMQDGKDTPEVRHAIEVGKKIMEPLAKQMKGELTEPQVVENETGSVVIGPVTPEELETKYKNFQAISFEVEEEDD